MRPSLKKRNFPQVRFRTLVPEWKPGKDISYHDKLNASDDKRWIFLKIGSIARTVLVSLFVQIKCYSENRLHNNVLNYIDTSVFGDLQWYAKVMISLASNGWFFCLNQTQTSEDKVLSCSRVTYLVLIVFSARSCGKNGTLLR